MPRAKENDLADIPLAEVCMAKEVYHRRRASTASAAEEVCGRGARLRA